MSQKKIIIFCFLYEDQFVYTINYPKFVITRVKIYDIFSKYFCQVINIVKPNSMISLI